MAHNVKLVEQNGGVFGMAFGRRAERLPHVHHRQANRFRSFGPQPLVKHFHARLGTIPAAKPDRSKPQQVAHDDPIRVSFANGNLVDADHLGLGATRPAQLFAHILLVQFLDRLPIQMQLFGHRLDRRIAAPASDIVGEAFGVKRTIRQPTQLLAFHTALVARHAPNLELQEDSQRPARQIPHHPRTTIVVASPRSTALTTDCFFARRRSGTTRCMGSPKTPYTSANGTKPGNRYASRNCRLGFAMRAI